MELKQKYRRYSQQLSALRQQCPVLGALLVFFAGLGIIHLADDISALAEINSVITAGFLAYLLPALLALATVPSRIKQSHK